VARRNAENRGSPAAFRGNAACARCKRPTFGPGLCNPCHARFRQGLSDALFTIGVMVAVPCVVGALYLWLAQGSRHSGGPLPDDRTLILGRAMSTEAAGYFWNLALSALTAALLSLGTFLALDLPRVLRREPRADIDFHDMVASLKDLGLLFEKRVTPAGPAPGEPDSADPLDYRTAMEQLHSMLGIEGEIPPEPETEPSEEKPALNEPTEEPQRDVPQGPAVRDVGTVESLIQPNHASQKPLPPDEPEPIEEPELDVRREAETEPQIEPDGEPQTEPEAQEAALEQIEPPAPAVQDVEPAPPAEPMPEPIAGQADQKEDRGEFVKVPSASEEPAMEQPAPDEPPVGEPADQEELPPSQPPAPAVRVKDSPFAQRHRLNDPLFETTPRPEPHRELTSGNGAAIGPAVEELIDEPIAFLFDRPTLPGLLQVRTSEWDQLPEEPTGEPAEDVAPSDEPKQPEPATEESETAPAPDDETTIRQLLGEDEESATIDELLGQQEESSAIDEMLSDLEDSLTPSDTTEAPGEDEAQPPAAESTPPETPLEPVPVENVEEIPPANQEVPQEPTDQETETVSPTPPQPAGEPESDEEPLPEQPTPPEPAQEQPAPQPAGEQPPAAEIILRGPKGSSTIETAVPDPDGQVACPGCGRRKPSPGPGRYNCSSCQTEFVVPTIIARCPGCGRERPSPGPGVYKCSQCTTAFRIPPMISCPGCGRSKPSPGTGRLKCSACGTVFEVINEAGAVR
jgi:hypothetical protein